MIRVVRNISGDDIHCALQCIICIADTLFLRDIFLRLSYRVSLRSGHYKSCQVCKTFFPRDICPGLSFRLIWSVKILKHGCSFCSFDLCRKPGGQLSLFFDRSENCFPAFFKIAQVFQPFVKCSEFLVVKRACRFFTVTGYKRYRASAVNKFDDCICLVSSYRKLFGDLLRYPAFCLSVFCFHFLFSILRSSSGFVPAHSVRILLSAGNHFIGGAAGCQTVLCKISLLSVKIIQALVPAIIYN